MGPENKKTDKKEEKNNEEDKEAAMEKDLDELRKAIEGTLDDINFFFSFLLSLNVIQQIFCAGLLYISPICFFLSLSNK